MNNETILVINPGSTSTKLALYEADRRVAEESAPFTAQEGGLWDQFDGRLGTVRAFLKAQGDPELAAVVGRGGLIRPVPSGTIRVNEAMLLDAREGYQGEHVSNLGCALADAVASERDIPAFIVDPVAVDEMDPLARYSGTPLMERQALSHALNLHAAARKACRETGKEHDSSRWVVAHLGGGFSIVPLAGGRILDTNNANSGGPFSPTRTGGLPVQGVIKLCFSGEYSAKDMKVLTTREGGLKAYLGTDDVLEIERRIEGGDEASREVYEAMVYQTAKEIGSMAAALSGRIDGVVITGGLAKSDRFCQSLEKRIAFLGPVLRFAGEFEMEALALGGLRVLRGEEKALGYPADHEESEP